MTNRGLCRLGAWLAANRTTKICQHQVKEPINLRQGQKGDVCRLCGVKLLWRPSERDKCTWGGI